MDRRNESLETKGGTRSRFSFLRAARVTLVAAIFAVLAIGVLLGPNARKLALDSRVFSNAQRLLTTKSVVDFGGEESAAAPPRKLPAEPAVPSPLAAVGKESASGWEYAEPSALKRLENAPPADEFSAADGEAEEGTAAPPKSDAVQENDAGFEKNDSDESEPVTEETAPPEPEFESEPTPEETAPPEPELESEPNGEESESPDDAETDFPTFDGELNLSSESAPAGGGTNANRVKSRYFARAANLREATAFDASSMSFARAVNLIDPRGVYSPNSFSGAAKRAIDLGAFERGLALALGKKNRGVATAGYDAPRSSGNGVALAAYRASGPSVPAALSRAEVGKDAAQARPLADSVGTKEDVWKLTDAERAQIDAEVKELRAESVLGARIARCDAERFRASGMTRAKDGTALFCQGYGASPKEAAAALRRNIQARADASPMGDRF